MIYTIDCPPEINPVKYLSALLFFLFISCGSKQEVLSLADLKAGEKAEIIEIVIPEAYLADSALHNRLLRGVGAKVGVSGTSRGAKEAERGTNYGFDIEGGSYFGLYEPQASMVKVKRIE